jgi:hypothetical protein
MSVRMFFGGTLIVIGGLLAMVCGGCAMIFLPAMTEGGLKSGEWQLLLFGGFLPAGVGLALIWGGWRLWKAGEEGKRRERP